MSELFYCDVCHRPLTKPIRCNHQKLCNKHYRQLRKYGKFLDDNPRTTMDRNDFDIYGKITLIHIYDKDCNKVADAIVDTKDLSKVMNIQWKLTASGYIVNSPKHDDTKHMSRIIFGEKNLMENQYVDHINHNTLDNRRCNLRAVTKSQNQMNVNYKGVDTRGDKYIARIKLHGKMVQLGTYYEEEEAYFARWYAEQLVFGEYRYSKEKPIVMADREDAIIEYVREKVQRL